MARILIVDDEEKIRTVIREYAVFNNYETDEAADGVEAVNKCLSQDYDLVIMDIMMPSWTVTAPASRSEGTRTSP